MSTKRSRLPPVAPGDIALTPERVRATPNGGHAWKCHYCGQYASSATAKGLFVCRRHGGSTPRQRGEVGAGSGELVRPPGRPITTGRGVRGPRLSVDELVQQYKAEQANVDATDENMVYLRAHLQEAIITRETEDVIEAVLLGLEERAESLEGFLARRPAVGDILEANEAIFEISRFARPLFRDGARLTRFMRETREIERRYERLIRSSTVRAKTRRTNAAVHQLREFSELLPKILGLLEPRLDEPTRLALVARLRREFSTVPMRALQQTALAALPAPGEARSSGPRTRLDAMADWVRQQSSSLDDPDTDSLYLRAYLENMENLFASTGHVKVGLERVQEAFAMFLLGIGCGREGRTLSVRDVLAEYGVGRQLKHLERTLTDVIGTLDRFGPEVEKWHVRLIELGLVRALGRDQERLAGELSLQRHLLRRLHAVLAELLEPEDVEYVEVEVLTDKAGGLVGQDLLDVLSAPEPTLLEPVEVTVEGD